MLSNTVKVGLSTNVIIERIFVSWYMYLPKEFFSFQRFSQSCHNKIFRKGRLIDFEGILFKAQELFDFVVPRKCSGTSSMANIFSLIRCCSSLLKVFSLCIKCLFHIKVISLASSNSSGVPRPSSVLTRLYTLFGLTTLGLSTSVYCFHSSYLLSLPFKAEATA